MSPPTSTVVSPSEPYQVGNNNANIKFGKEAEQLFIVCNLTSTLVRSCLPFPDRTNYGYLFFASVTAPVSVDLNVRPVAEVYCFKLCYLPIR
ncbi:hypothetical protein ZWY2020_037725 [Hordeum vulgare]|nr:hypothetical protein ZWY2020_037725 [Hordeum vulgare]